MIPRAISAILPPGSKTAHCFPSEESEDFTWQAYDGLEVYTALDRQEPSQDSINIRWGRADLELLEPGEELSRCRHLESGRELDILNDYLYEADGATYTQDATDYRLEVRPGDTLSLVRRVQGGCLAKKNSVTGWYFGRFREKQA